MQSQPERDSMSNQNILNNEAAMSILRDAAERLQVIGVHCMVSPMSLPQGTSVNLHAGATAEASTGAVIASECGGEYAHAVETHQQFARKVELAIADAADVEATITEFARKPARPYNMTSAADQDMSFIPVAGERPSKLELLGYIFGLGMLVVTLWRGLPPILKSLERWID